MVLGEAVAGSIPGIELIEELGRGGSSIVYRGRRGGQPCAVKIARRAGRDARWFRREAAVLARVRHPSIPAVLDLGEVEGRPYLVMELVDGETLAQRLVRGSLSEPEALDIAARLLDALVPIHQRGLVHRDITPRNIVIDPGGDVRLVDFGFATFSSMPQDLAGTRAYAAPEQLRLPVAVDARTDLFAVGAVLMECLTGSPSLEDADPRSLGLPDSVVPVIAGLLAPEPASRYASAGAAAGDLERVRSGTPAVGPAGARETRPEAVPFVSRAEEQATLLETWSNAREGHGAVTLVRGPPGSGKTRLLRETLRIIRGQHHFTLLAEARCVEGDPRPLAALRQVLEEIARAAANPELRDAVALAASPDMAPVVMGLSPPLARVLGIDVSARPSVDAEAFAGLVAELLERIAEKVGTLGVFVDDAQWLDASSADVFSRLADRAIDEPILAVLAAREDPFAGRALVPPTIQSVKLGPLPEAAVGKLVRGYLAAEPEPALVEWLSSVSDRTPLDLIDVLDGMLDCGAIGPRDGTWWFDRSRAEHLDLPRNSRERLARRLDDLSDATYRLLRCASVIGPCWPEDLAGRVADLDAVTVRSSLAEAMRLQLIEIDHDAVGSHRFVHDSIRHGLLADVPPEERRTLHARIARALEDAASCDVYRVAAHYGLAGDIAPADSVYESAAAAAARALDDLDSEATLRFFEIARLAADRSQRMVDATLLRSAGEAALRTGAHGDSVGFFSQAISRATSPVERATMFGRIAWAEQGRSNPDAAWEALRRGFAELGEAAPTARAVPLASAAFDWYLTTKRERPSAQSTDRDEVLGQLYYQATRLAVEHEQLFVALESTLRMRALADRLPNQATLARADACSGTLLAIVGRRNEGIARIERAMQEAAESGRPDVEVYCLQLRSLAACFAGDFERALALTAELVFERGAWLEMHDYCLNVFNAHLIETLRGRVGHSHRWLDAAIRRARPQGRVPTAFAVVAHCARATMTALGESTTQQWSLSARVDFESPISDYLGKFTWGSRARYLLERGETGAAFDRLVAEFEREKINPRFAHPVLVEYYVAVAEARVHRALRTHGEERSRQTRLLKQAIGDLRAIARYPLFQAHLRLAEGFHAYLTGDHDKARKKLAKAERLADQENCPGVLFGVARAHAHVLREEGKGEASQERARVALAIAKNLGAVQRLRWVQDELGGAWSTVDAARRSVVLSSGSSRRQLKTLLELLRACNVETDPVEQARALLDELVETVDATHAALVFGSGRATEPLAVARTRDGGDWTANDDAQSLMSDARGHGAPQAADLRPDGLGDDVVRALAVPLFLGERVVGSVYVERGAAATPFGEEETDILVALSHQVPIALELTRTLIERQELEESLRRAQRMESIGRFAGGIAHDFNNMLTAMEAGLALVMGRDELGTDAKAELDMVHGAVRRAAGLTRQLLTFSRRQVPTTETQDVNATIESVGPMLRRLLGPHIEVHTELSARNPISKIDGSLFEQAIVNLSLNARDAMPRGGSLTISTRDILFDGNGAPPPRGLSEGPHVVVSVRDTGIGMVREVRDSAFEPFFTTKGRGQGTGLGLSIVYGFVQQSEGAIELDSEPGKGTEFRIYLPRVAEPIRRAPASVRPPARPSDPRQLRSETILLVDDEELVLRAIRRNLEREGYRVLSAHEARAALDIMRAHEGEVDLLITNMLLPGMPGTELAKEVSHLSPRTKLLLISGYTDGEVGELIEDAVFLQKPFQTAHLSGLVRELLGHSPSPH